MTSLAALPVSEYEYLHTDYEPDCDYIGGELQERGVGERPHNAVQYILTEIFNRHRREWKVIAFQEQRIQVSEGDYRVPDVCVLRRSDPADDIVQVAPLVCIEVLSPEDRTKRLLERFADYSRMGVPNLWLIDPIGRHAWCVLPDGSQQRVPDAFTVAETPISVSLAEVWAELDDLQSVG